MKELIKKTVSLMELKSDETIATATVHICVALFGLLSSFSSVMSVLRPFGIALCTAIPFTYMPAVAIGTFIGYFIGAVEAGGFRYVTTMLAVVAIRSILSGYKSLSKSPLFLCAVSFTCTAAGIFIFSFDNLIPLIAEPFITAGTVYCLKVAFRAVAHIRTGLLPQELASLLLSAAVFIGGFENISVYGISLSRAIWIFLILAAARYGGVAISSFAGISATFFCSLNMNSNYYAVFSIMGLMAGILSIYGKYAVSLVSVAVSLIAIAANGGVNSAPLMAETIIGCILFLMLPKNFGVKAGAILTPRPKVTLQSDIKNMLKIRLLDLSGALKDVSGTVDKVSSRLSVMHAPEYKNIYKDIENSACAGCKLRLHCWESKRDATIEAAVCVINGAKGSLQNGPAVLPEEFRARCIRTESFSEETIKHYNIYASRVAAENRIAEVRDIVSEQFSGMSMMLSHLSEEIENSERFDEHAGICAAAAFKQLGIFPTESICKTDRFGRTTLKIKARADKDTVVNKMKIMRAVSLALGLKFDIPSVTSDGENMFIRLCEAPKLKINVGAYRITAAGSAMCGDSYQYFPDGRGRFFVVLSDGMGTGGAAAVDSAMATDLMSRLIKSGFDFSCALKILNSSMLFKSSDESLATLDIACIDLYNGKVNIYKAGAAPTVVRRGGRAGVAEGTSLPVGILKDVSFDKAQVSLKSGDVVVVMSDGALCDGTEWIKREVENNRETDPEVLAEHLALSARRRRTEPHEDDITVIVAQLEKTV